MTTVAVAPQIAQVAAELCATSGIARPDVTGLPASALEFNPDLSAGDQAKVADIVTMAKFGIGSNLTLAEFQAIKPDLATARAFLGIASPTAAQSNAALKSTIRVLGALLRA